MTAPTPAPLACPVPSPDGVPCTKTIPPGWAVEDGHAGGHFWATPEVVAALNGGHYDASDLLAGKQVRVHQPADCPGPPECFGGTR